MRRGWVVVVAALLGACSSPAATTVGAARARQSLRRLRSGQRCRRRPPLRHHHGPDRVPPEPWMRSLERLIGGGRYREVVVGGVRVYGHLPRSPGAGVEREAPAVDGAPRSVGPGFRIVTGRPDRRATGAVSSRVTSG